MPDRLTVSRLHKRYRDKHAVKGVSFSLRAGEAVGLLGANGAGKSTLIKCILGLTRISEGSVVCPDCSPSYLPELPQLPVSISALALLNFKCSASGIDPVLAKETLAAVKLAPDALNRPIGNYSKGMRQRTALALTLCGDPKLVCLDEPMSGLDALGRAEVLQLLKKKKQMGAAFLMSSHIVSDMVQLCERVLIMAHGTICEEIHIKDHSLAEAKVLEEKLAQWTHQ